MKPYCGPCYPTSKAPRELRQAALPTLDQFPSYIAVDETQEPGEDSGLRSDAALFFPGR